jgi:hypothetical protein
VLVLGIASGTAAPGWIETCVFIPDAGRSSWGTGGA